MNFIKSNLISCIILLSYYLWWSYLFFSFGQKNYGDNGNAAVMAIELLAIMTCVLIVLGLVFFLVQAITRKEWIKNLIFMLLLFVPVLSIFLLR